MVNVYSSNLKRDLHLETNFLSNKCLYLKQKERERDMFGVTVGFVKIMRTRASFIKHTTFVKLTTHQN